MITKISLIFLLLLAVGAGVFLLPIRQPVARPEPPSAQESTATPTATPTLLPTATPTPIPTPTIDYSAIGPCCNVPILMYHHVNTFSGEQATSASLTVKTEVFGQQMDYLQQHGYTAITIHHLLEILTGGGPAKPVIISFDDGYRDFYTDAWPTLRSHGFPAILFVVSGLVESSDQYVTWDQLRQMKAEGLEVGNHTWSHLTLGSASREKIEYEIATAQKQIGDFLGAQPEVFSFPYGASSSTAIQVLQMQGIRAAVLTSPRQQCAGALYSFGRQRIGNASLAAYGL